MYLRFRFFLFVFILMFFALNGFAQSYSISPENLDDAVYSHVKVMGQDEEGFYMLQSNLSLASDRVRDKHLFHQIK